MDAVRSADYEALRLKAIPLSAAPFLLCFGDFASLLPSSFGGNQSERNHAPGAEEREDPRIVHNRRTVTTSLQGPKKHVVVGVVFCDCA